MILAAMILATMILATIILATMRKIRLACIILVQR